MSKDLNSNNEELAELIIKGKKFKLPIKKASVGQSVIDISKLYNQTGYFTYDPGLISTASCCSEITYIDGELGILRYRGYDIKELANKKNFLEVSYLLLYQDLPTDKEYKLYQEKITNNMLVNEQIRNIFSAFRHSAHPMAIILSVVGSLSAFYHDTINMASEYAREACTIKMIAKIPTIAAMTYKYTLGQAFIYPQEHLTFSENLLHMMFAKPNGKYKINKVFAKALDKILILHADHEQNASTSTVRTVGSSKANPFACVSAGIASLWGPSHGGANEAVIKMLTEIGTTSNINKYIKKAKDKDDPFKLMGFGHRVYKNYDPRATILQNIYQEVLYELGNKEKQMMKIAIELEKIVLNDEYFISRKLYPNIDFYSGIIYQAMGIPLNMYTVLFAVARTVGWVSQWKEMWHYNKDIKITRPRQLYLGHIKRSL